MKKKSALTTILVTIIMLASAFFMSSCATIMNGNQQKIPISTTPPGAKITIYDSHNMIVWSSKSPTTVYLKRGQGYFQGASYRVVIEKTGYKPKEFQITSTLNAGWYIVGNFFIGGWIGWLIVDPITGAMWNLQPEKISLALESGILKSQNSLNKENTMKKVGLRIILKKDINEDIFQKLAPIRIN